MKKLKFIRANQTKHGGAEVYLSRVSDELKRVNIEHNIVYSDISKRLPSWLRVFYFNHTVCKAKKDDSFYFSLERISCPDIYRAGDGVHKVFMQVEQKSFLNPLHMIYLFLEKKCFQNAKKIIANSLMIKKQIIETYGIESEKITVVHNGVNKEEYNYHESFVRLEREWQIHSEEKIILYVGSGFKRKGVEVFLHILSKLTYQKYKAFVVGKEKKIAYYQNLAKTLNIEDKVIFTGARDDVKDFYVIADIFLFPTRYEPFSNVVLEAMNYENVVITTKQNGASEILDTEYIMQTPDDFTIVSKLDDLLYDDKKLETLKKRNLEIAQNYSIEKNVAETLKVIDEVMH